MNGEVKHIRGYIYPYSGREGRMTNPYISNFIEALKGRIDIMNGDRPSNSGIFDILKYVRKINILFLNWPEEILEKKGSIFQALFFIILVYYLRLRRVKIFLTFHNKESHFSNKKRLKNWLRNFSIRKSDYIITHAKEGIPIIEKLSKNSKTRIRFFHHPILTPINVKRTKPELYDILIWGLVTPYKGIDKFLEYTRDTCPDYFKILIAGRISDPSYREIILSYRSSQVLIVDEFVSEELLEDYISKSRLVLFTYLESSILSSGALMDTLKYAPLIIGPNHGAFRDLQEEGLIFTFNDYAHLTELLNATNIKPDVEKIHSFVNANSWKNFGDRIYDFINSEYRQ